MVVTMFCKNCGYEVVWIRSTSIVCGIMILLLYRWWYFELGPTYTFIDSLLLLIGVFFLLLGLFPETICKKLKIDTKNKYVIAIVTLLAAWLILEATGAFVFLIFLIPLIALISIKEKQRTLIITSLKIFLLLFFIITLFSIGLRGGTIYQSQYLNVENYSLQPPLDLLSLQDKSIKEGYPSKVTGSEISISRKMSPSIFTPDILKIIIYENGNVKIIATIFNGMTENEINNNVGEILNDIGIPKEMINDFRYEKIYFDY